MPVHLQRDLDRLKRDILELGGLVEEAVAGALTAFIERRRDLALQVMEGDRRIDLEEVVVEEECLKILALHHPVAHDLRFIVAVMKVNNDLERMADLAVNLAERAAVVAVEDPLPLQLDFPAMGRRVRAMLRESLDALVKVDLGLARKVLASDDEVDDMNRAMFNAVQQYMQEDPEAISRAVHYISASRHLERIADLSTNVAEDVIFLVSGEVVRHRTEDYLAAQRQADEAG